MNRQIKIHQFNPKCMSKTELFGRLTDSNQWVDGVLTSYSLQVVAEKGKTLKSLNLTIHLDFIYNVIIVI